MDGLTRVVVWDVDDVLNGLMGIWFTDVWARSHPGSGIRYEDLRENSPLDQLGLNSSDYARSLDEFRMGRGYQGFEPNPEVLTWLREHGTHYRHVALSATAHRAAPTTGAWVLRHFGVWIREFAFIPAHRPGEPLPAFDRDKGTWIARRVAGLPVLVDDSPTNITAATAAGVSGLFWPQPWNEAALSTHDTLDALTRMLEAPQAT